MPSKHCRNQGVLWTLWDWPGELYRCHTFGSCSIIASKAFLINFQFIFFKKPYSFLLVHVGLGRTRSCQKTTLWTPCGPALPPFCFGAAAAFLLCLNCVVNSLISNTSRMSVALPRGRAVVTAECGAALQLTPPSHCVTDCVLPVSCAYIACGLLWLYFSFFSPFIAFTLFVSFSSSS